MGDEVLLSKSKIPSDGILESLYKLRIRGKNEGCPLGGNRRASDRGTPSIPPTTFLPSGRKRCAVTGGVFNTACARTLAGTRWFEKFEVDLKKNATTVEVVPNNETFRFGLGAVEKFSCSFSPVAVGQTVFFVESKPSGRGGPLVDQHGSVIDEAQKTIEF